MSSCKGCCSSLTSWCAVMAKFEGLPVPLLPINQCDWVVQERFTFRSNVTGTRIIVPQGAVTDFASVPRALWSVYPRWGDHGFAAILHDWLYRARLKGVSRKVADLVFLEAMEDLSVPYIRRKTMYRAVRMFGGAAWRK